MGNHEPTTPAIINNQLLPTLGFPVLKVVAVSEEQTICNVQISKQKNIMYSDFFILALTEEVSYHNNAMCPYTVKIDLW